MWQGQGYAAGTQRHAAGLFGGLFLAIKALRKKRGAAYYGPRPPYGFKS